MLSLRPRTRAAAPGRSPSPALLVGWLGLSRYVFGGETLFAFADMAVHTALLILLLCAGALTLRTDAGIAALLASDGVGGGMARRLLPAAVIVPLVAGALTVHYERRATFSFEAAVAVFALLSIIAFVAFVWINAARGERADRLRRTRRARAAAVRGTPPAQLRDRARRHRHDRPPRQDHRLEHAGGKDVRLAARARRWAASSPS